MLIIVCALHDEAAALIELYGMRRDVESKAHHVFFTENCFLILSGIGKLRSAIATTRAILEVNYGQEAQRFANTRPVIVNFGTCAARSRSADKHVAVGDLYLAHRVVDHSSSRAFHSDLLVKTEVPSATIETFDLPISSVAALSDDSDLADMEASGFFEAASAFFAPHQIYCLKIVSDILENSDSKSSFGTRSTVDLKQFAETARKLISECAPRIQQCLQALQSTASTPK